MRNLRAALTRFVPHNLARGLRFSGRTMSRKQHIWDLCDKVQRDLKLADLQVEGSATDGTYYSSIKAMWSAELGLGTPALTTASTVAIGV